MSARVSTAWASGFGLGGSSKEGGEVRFHTGAYPCYVMHLKNLQSLTRLITHEEALKAGLLQELTRGSRTPDGASTYFVSQTWEAADGSHPDNERNTKLKWLQNIKHNMRLQKGRELWMSVSR